MKWRKVTAEYFGKSKSLCNTIVLIDCRRGILDSDRLLFDMLQENKRSSTVVLTKADTLHPGKLKDALIKTAHEVAKFPRTFGTVFATSSKLMYGIKELQAFLVYDLLNKFKGSP